MKAMKSSMEIKRTYKLHVSTWAK